MGVRIVDVIVHKSCPYSRQWIHDAMNVGFAPEFQIPMPIERVRVHRQDPEEFDRVASRINQSLWPWQARCLTCGRIRDKQDLRDGKCEHCQERAEDGTQ
jgi:hypothetical protein